MLTFGSEVASKQRNVEQARVFLQELAQVLTSGPSRKTDGIASK